MGLKNLKEQNPDMNINLIDLISKLDTTKTKKITPFLVNFLKNSDWKYESYYNRYIRGDENFKELNLFEKFFYVRILEYFFGDDVNTINDFCGFLEKGLIERKDISTYKTLEEINDEVCKASTKEMLRKSKKDIMIVHDDEEWIMFKPLSHSASITYGYGTKWCTSMKHEPEYFYRYSNEGILIYVINKKTNRKFGFFNGESGDMIKIYDERDIQIDSYHTSIPYELMGKLMNLLDPSKNKNNYHFFSEIEKIESEIYYRNERPVRLRPINLTRDVEPIPTPEPRPTLDGIRIENGCETLRLLRGNNEIIDDLP